MAFSSGIPDNSEPDEQGRGEAAFSTHPLRRKFRSEPDEQGRGEAAFSTHPLRRKFRSEPDEQGRGEAAFSTRPLRRKFRLALGATPSIAFQKLAKKEKSDQSALYFSTICILSAF
jgi:hypothetical protein